MQSIGEEVRMMSTKQSYYQKRKAEVREEVIEYSYSEEELSYGELAEIQDYFRRLSKRYGLLREFKENMKKKSMKKEVENKLYSLAEKLHKTYMEYLDSLQEEGNEIGKKEGYLSVTIWRESISIVSTNARTELRKANQIDMWKHK